MEFKLSKRCTELPPLDRWIDPKYFGFGDLITKIVSANSSRSDFIGAGDKVNDPRNWKQDFPGFDYRWPALVDLKARLNVSKHKLDKYTENKIVERKFTKIMEIVRLLDDLRGTKGIIATTKGGEIVTNAWMKMYELCKYLELPATKTKAGRRKDVDFNSFHIAEAPGNFMLAINHYLKTQWKDGNWKWYANTYRPGEDETHLLDQYGLIAQFPKQWLWGADGDGDITSASNILSFREKLRNIPIHLITSDVKYVPPGEMTWDEEERINIPVHLGHTLTSLTVLETGGTAILKEFTFFESHSVNLLWLLNYCFKEVIIVKPETSRPANSEVYLVLRGYKKNLTEQELERLFNIMRYVREMHDPLLGSPAIFQQDDIPISFVEKVIEIMCALVDKQIVDIDRNVSLYEIYKDLSYDEIREAMRDLRETAAKAWLERVHVDVLNDEDRIILPASGGRRDEGNRKFDKKKFMTKK